MVRVTLSGRATCGGAQPQKSQTRLVIGAVQQAHSSSTAEVTAWWIVGAHNKDTLAGVLPNARSTVHAPAAGCHLTGSLHTPILSKQWLVLCPVLG